MRYTKKHSKLIAFQKILIQSIEIHNDIFESSVNLKNIKKFLLCSAIKFKDKGWLFLNKVDVISYFWLRINYWKIDFLLLNALYKVVGILIWMKVKNKRTRNKPLKMSNFWSNVLLLNFGKIDIRIFSG